MVPSGSVAVEVSVVSPPGERLGGGDAERPRPAPGCRCRAAISHAIDVVAGLPTSWRPVPPGVIVAMPWPPPPPLVVNAMRVPSGDHCGQSMPFSVSSACRPLPPSRPCS